MKYMIEFDDKLNCSNCPLLRNSQYGFYCANSINPSHLSYIGNIKRLNYYYKNKSRPKWCPFEEVE